MKEPTAIIGMGCVYPQANNVKAFWENLLAGKKSTLNLFSQAIDLPLIGQFGQYLKLAVDHYSDLRAAGQAAGPEIVAMFLREKMSNWDPRVGTTSLLDDETRAAAARFLAGVAVNFSGAQ